MAQFSLYVHESGLNLDSFHLFTTARITTNDTEIFDVNSKTPNQLL